jgi:chloramphenicol O-acetyltransferase type A
VVRSLDLASWSRRRHFSFFKDFDQPFFNVCTEVETTDLVDLTAAQGRSFFLGALYLSLRAANAVEELRLRIRGDDVVIHEMVHGGSTILRQDDTFGFGYFDYGEDFDAFESHGREVLKRVRDTETLDDEPERDDLIYSSVLPWFSFTSFSHARRCPATDSNPRIVFGKRHSRADGTWHMPISIEVHHGLVDGIHVGRFLEAFAELLKYPRAALLG